MKKFTLVLFSFIWQFSFAQSFSFELYFEDATGAKDTLEFGYDPTATDSIDPTFQETNIIAQPWSSQFEARIIVLTNPYAFGFEEYATVPEAGHLKKQIKLEDCLDQSVHISMIQMKNAVYPVTITWDHTLFNDICRSNTIITDWHPGVWFDAIIGSNPQLPYELKLDVPATFTHTSTHNIASNQDTLDVLFFALGSVNQVFVGIEEQEQSKLNAAPNPVTDLLHFDIQGSEELQSVALFDLNGKQQNVVLISNSLEMRAVPAGIYIAEVLFKSGCKQAIRVVKE
jgi:hypothetical protein